jgi:hypothetical protein
MYIYIIYYKYQVLTYIYISVTVIQGGPPGVAGSEEAN